jgi:TetR/AcrR family transcriptional repressor of mexJK operon
MIPSDAIGDPPAIEEGSKARGRPRDPAKREAVIAAARALFLQDGVDAVTMDQIVAASGVARGTLYSYYQDKGELFEAVITQELDRMLGGHWFEDGLSGDFRTALLHFGERLLVLISSPDQLNCEKLLSQATVKSPEYGPRFFAAGPGRGLAFLTRLIEVGQTRSIVGPADPAVAARDLLSLWMGFWRTEVLLGVRPALNPTEVKAIVAHGVNQFVALYCA